MPSTIGIVASSVEFSPLSLSAALWLDASDTSTITSSGSPAKVSEWRDKSGNGRNVTQATAANQPTTGAATQNSLNVLSFDGSATVLSGGDVLDLGTNNISVYSVTRRASGAAGPVIGKYRASPLNGSWLQTWQTPTNLVLDSIFRTGGVSATARSSTWTSTGYNVTGFQINRSAGTIQQRVNKADNGSTTFTPDSATSYDIVTGLWIGALRNATDNGFVSGFWLNGNIAEIVVVLRNLSTSERSDLENYLTTKWGL